MIKSTYSYSQQLFLGFPLEKDFVELLNQINPYLRDLFIKKNGDYLQEIDFNQINYLGKYAGFIIDSQALEQLEDHIYSLLKKLVPNYPYHKGNLVLFPISQR